ncbi:hypothetical protein [Streptomyces sp. NTH33]|uniref:hypothetical protein n=1 Tax=Streptomyces sp. NTH33 TaxID=1735453 RepID=UPI0011B9427F|nr:hypothetical protein [Streptomyces sp. NTH33]
MSSEGSKPRAGGWLERELLDEGHCPRKLELVLALRPLLCLLKTEESTKSGDRPPTQAEVAKLLGTNPTSLSRFASLDPRVPNQRFIEELYKAACLSANSQDVGITLDALQTLRVNAEAENRGLCERCAELGRRIDSLAQQLSAPCSACAVLQQEQVAYQQERKENAARMAALRKEVAAMRAAIQKLEAVEAGLQARLAMAQASRAPLPVPLRKGDRQRSEKERVVARQLAAQAAELDAAGKEDSALTLLRQGTTELLSPSETALVMVELRQQERDHLADNLIHVYGRDQGDRHVMTVALELHAEGAVDDAGAILHAALR